MAYIFLLAGADSAALGNADKVLLHKDTLGIHLHLNDSKILKCLGLLKYLSGSTTSYLRLS